MSSAPSTSTSMISGRRVLMERWQRVGLSRLTLDVIDCPDRRLGRAALELAAELADGETEVSMLLPRRSYGKAPAPDPPRSDGRLHRRRREPAFPRQRHHRPLHGRTGHRTTGRGGPRAAACHEERAGRSTSAPACGPKPPRSPLSSLKGVTPIAALQWRHSARIAGRVTTLRVQPWSGVPTLECVLVDNSGESIVLVFLGRRSIPGIRSGTLWRLRPRWGSTRACWP